MGLRIYGVVVGMGKSGFENVLTSVARLLDIYHKKCLDTYFASLDISVICLL